MDMMERTVNVERVEDLISVFGSFDEIKQRLLDNTFESAKRILCSFRESKYLYKHFLNIFVDKSTIL